MPEATKKGSKKTAKTVVVENAENMDLASLYDQVDAQRQTKSRGNTPVNADQIREFRDELFASGKTEISVATLQKLIDMKFGLTKTEDGDNRVQNASVRSAAGSGDYEVVNRGNVAYIVRKA